MIVRLEHGIVKSERDEKIEGRDCVSVFVCVCVCLCVFFFFFFK